MSNPEIDFRLAFLPPQIETRSLKSSQPPPTTWCQPGLSFATPSPGQVTTAQDRLSRGNWCPPSLFVRPMGQLASQLQHSHYLSVPLHGSPTQTTKEVHSIC